MQNKLRILQNKDTTIESHFLLLLKCMFLNILKLGVVVLAEVE